MNTITETIEDFKAELLRQDKSLATVTNYANDVMLFIKWIQETYGAFDLGKVVQRDVIEYRSYLLTVQNAAANSVNRKIASLNSFFRWQGASSKGKPKPNPCEGVKTIATADPAPGALDEKSLRRLLREVHVHGSARDIAIVETLCHTAVRIGELTQLAVSDCQLSDRKGLLHVRYGKGRTARTIPLNVDARKALSAWLLARPATASTALFVGQRGELMTPSGIWRIVKKYGRMGNLPDLKPHMLRKTTLTRLLRTCHIDVATVMKLSGHRDAKTLLTRYTQPNMEDLSEAVERLAFTGE